MLTCNPILLLVKNLVKWLVNLFQRVKLKLVTVRGLTYLQEQELV